jgi:ribosomal protein S18 acetylase RimI-like enzyme
MEMIRLATLDDAVGIAHAHVDSWRTTYKDRFAENIPQFSYQWREENWRQILSNPQRRSVVFVATNEDGRIVGFASGGPEHTGDPVYQGEIYAIYLRQDGQRRGLGRRLIRVVVEELVQRGLTAMRIWVLEGNPACRFYESLGGKVIETMQETEYGSTHTLICYGWLDIRPLLADK